MLANWSLYFVAFEMYFLLFIFFFVDSCLGHYVLIKPSFVGWSPYSVVNLVWQLLTVSLLV